MGKSTIISKRTLNTNLSDLTVGELREFVDAFGSVDDNNKVSVYVSHGNRPGESSTVSISADLSYDPKDQKQYRATFPPLGPAFGGTISNSAADGSDYVGPYGNGVPFGD